MTTDSKAAFPLMQVSQILDKSTVVLTGDKLDDLTKGDELFILAKGSNVGATGAPLYLPKATVEVDAIVPGHYLIAKSPTYEVEETTNSLLSGGVFGPQTRTVTKRATLRVTESELVGNPALTPVKVGDTVIRERDFGAFVTWMSGPPPPRD
jgi:hypothetical protein